MKDQRRRWAHEEEEEHTVTDGHHDHEEDHHSSNILLTYDNLFFDLFYVAFAYQLSYILRTTPTPRGLLYFVSCFYNVQTLWWDKTIYDARYYILYENLYHDVYNVCVLLCLGSVVLHIRPISILSDVTNNAELFALCLSLVLSNLFSIGRDIELMIVYRNTSNTKKKNKKPNSPEDGDDVNKNRNAIGNAEQIQTGATSEIIRKSARLILTSAATIYTGIQYYSTTATHDDDYHRKAPLATTINDEDDVPIYILFALFLIEFIFITCINYYRSVIMRRRASHKERRRSVPIDIHFTIHRCSEWILIMMGESIFSLLITTLPPFGNTSKTVWEYYVTFMMGIITILLLKDTYFSSEPSDPENHAWRKSVGASFRYFMLFQILSAALIALGASYELMLATYSTPIPNSNADDTYYDNYDKNTTAYTTANNYTYDRGLSEEFVNEEDSSSSSLNTTIGFFLYSFFDFSPHRHRGLAGGGDDDDVLLLSNMKTNIALLFSGSLFVIYVCLDFILMNHGGGWMSRWSSCQLYRRVAVLYIGLPRLLLLVFTFGMGFLVPYLFQEKEENDSMKKKNTPNNPSFWILSILGFVTMLLQLVSRFVSSMIINQQKQKCGLNNKKHVFVVEEEEPHQMKKNHYRFEETQEEEKKEESSEYST